MSHIQPLTFLDTWAMSSTLFARYKDRFGGDHHSAAVLPLRSGDGPLPILAEWKSAKALLSRIRAAAAPFMDGRTPELGAAALVQLRPGGFVEWSADETPVDQSYSSLHLCLVPAPDAWVYSGGQCAVLPVGQLTYVNRRVLWSAANFSPTPAIHLVVDVRRAEADD